MLNFQECCCDDEIINKFEFNDFDEDDNYLYCCSENEIITQWKWLMNLVSKHVHIYLQSLNMQSSVNEAINLKSV